MKLKITWDGNDDGALRWLNQRGATLKIWVLVKDEDDKPLSAPCTLKCAVRDTLFIRWLKRVGPRLRRGASKKPRRLKVLPRGPALPEFIVTGAPGRFLPYWLDFQAVEASTQRERTKVFVAPRANRLLSLLFVGLGGVCLAYSSWLLWNLRSETLPQQYLTIFGTASAVLAPFGAIAAPFLSANVRRYGSDALASGAAMCACVLFAAGLLHYQVPIYIENDTPSAFNAAADGKRIQIEPGAAAVVPRDQLDAAWLQALPELKRRPDALPPEHWFKAGEYCSYEADSKNCVELRPATFFTRMQRWLAPEGGIRIGCNAIDGLDTDAIEAWKKSGSCRHDPEVSVKRSLHDHLVRSSVHKQGKPAPCSEPEGEVILKPFRTASRTDRSSPLLPAQVPLIWPDNALDGVPSWRFTGSGPLADILLQPSVNANAEPCAQPYVTDCPNDREHSCPGLFTPPGQISATLSLGEQKLGTLWCAAPVGNLLTLRLRSRVVGLSILDDQGRALSRFASESDVSGGWVAWCEPPRDKPSGGKAAVNGALHAEVTLPDDWQPVKTWEWHAPAASAVNSLDIFVRGRGRWGTLACEATGQERVVWLQEIRNTQARAVSEAFTPSTAWVRYGETTLFPHWIWRCGQQKDSGLKLSAIRDDGTAGTIVSGSFAASPPVACVIDRLTGARLPGTAPKTPGAVPATELLDRFRIAACDPKKSVFAVAGGQ